MGKPAWNKQDISHQRFGKLTVQSKYEIRNGKTYWECLCDCGKIKLIQISKLRNGRTKSCGCLNLELIKERAITHGLSKHPIYNMYSKIKERCYNTKSKAYPRYGGRGVIMCEQWKNDFMSFFNWCISNGWERGLEIDKDIIAYNQNVPSTLYSPERCQFVTPKINAQYKSNSNHIEYNGQSKSLGEWSKETGIKSGTIWSRFRLAKWSAEETFNTPVRKNKSHTILLPIETIMVISLSKLRQAM